MRERQTVRLYASGLGLMLYSSAVESLLEEAHDYMPAGGDLRQPLRDLVEKEQRVVLLQTGSPQLDYVLHARVGAPTKDVKSRAAARVRFGLSIGGGALCVRDGYDPMEWHAEGESVRRFPIPDGYYVVDALWTPDSQDGMTITLFFQSSTKRIVGDGWPVLEYRVRRE